MQRRFLTAVAIVVAACGGLDEPDGPEAAESALAAAAAADPNGAVIDCVDDGEVCGADGLIYENACEARRLGVRLADDEICREPEPPAACPRGFVQVAPGKNVVGLDEEVGQRPRVGARDRIDVDLRVDGQSGELVLHVRFHNPYRCHWRGDLFLEGEAPDGAIRTIARAYGVTIRGGSTLAATIILPHPAELGAYLFTARAYHRDGQDFERFFNRVLDAVADRLSAAGPGNKRGLLLAPEVIDAKLSPEAADVGELVDGCPDAAVALRAPILVDLILRILPGRIEALGQWENVSRRDWRGDLYVDVTSPANRIEILRRDLGTRIPAGIGFCTYDTTRRPGPPGIYRFAARALRRDGSDEARWLNPGTTEINAVCNGDLCELIEPEQERARIELTGRSQIHLESDFFSEHTRVWLAYGGRRFDITRQCRIRQHPAGGKNHIEVHFNTMNLPIGPRTWARYVIELHPMPVVPPGAKTRDALWILTNGAELDAAANRGP